jgi:hypothetical protein
LERVSLRSGDRGTKVDWRLGRGPWGPATKGKRESKECKERNIVMTGRSKDNLQCCVQGRKVGECTV